jgi:hypothetical protein
MAGRRNKSAAVKARAQASGRIIGSDIATQLAELETLDLDDLRARWLKVTGRPAPRAFRRDLLARALAHEIQVVEFGGLSLALKRRLHQLAEAARDDRFDEVLGTSSMKPGTLLVRVWQGRTHRVMVARDGFVWNGDSYSSLSTIAKTITGTSWNGWLFFGLKRRYDRNKNAGKSRAQAGREAAHA